VQLVGPERDPGQLGHALAGHHHGHLVALLGQPQQLLQGRPRRPLGQDPVVGPEPPGQVGGERLQHLGAVVDQEQDRLAHGHDGRTDTPGAFPARAGRPNCLAGPGSTGHLSQRRTREPGMPRGLRLRPGSGPRLLGAVLGGLLVWPWWSPAAS